MNKAQRNYFSKYPNFQDFLSKFYSYCSCRCSGDLESKKLLLESNNQVFFIMWIKCDATSKKTKFLSSEFVLYYSFCICNFALWIAITHSIRCDNVNTWSSSQQIYQFSQNEKEKNKHSHLKLWKKDGWKEN